MTTTPRVSILDLSIATIRSIETADDVASQMTDWGQPASQGGPKSRAALYARIYSAGSGKPFSEVEKMTMRELASVVVIAEGVEEGEVDPT